MIFYLIQLLIFIIYSLFFLFIIKRKKLYSIMVIFHLSLLAGLRSYLVGTDTSSYVSYYLDQNFQFNGNGSWLYVLLEKIIWWFANNNYHILLLTLSVCTVFLFIYAFDLYSSRNNLFYFLSIYIYISFYFYFNSFNAQRQFLAIALCFFSMMLLSKGRSFYSVLFFVMAIGIHSTAIVMILGFIIWKMKKNWITLSVMTVIGFIGIFYFDKMFTLFSSIFTHYSAYTEVNTQYIASGGTAFLGVAVLLIVAISIGLTDVLKRNESGFFTVMTAIGAILYIYGMKSQLIIRIADYFFIFSTVFLPTAIYKLSMRFKSKQLAYGLFFALLMMMGLILLIFRLSKNMGEIIPYTV